MQHPGTPDLDPDADPDAADPDAADPDDPVEILAREWVAEVDGTSYVPFGAQELLDHLREIAGELVAGALAVPPRPEVGDDVGRRMVSSHFTGPSTVERTIALLAARLPTLLGEATAPAVHAMVGALARGYSTALRDRTLEEQEAIRRAVLVARHQTEQALHASEARFRAMFYEAAIGIGLGDAEGRILEVNPALCRMFAADVSFFHRTTLFDLAHPDDAAEVWAHYQRLVRGETDNVRLQRQFRRVAGDEIIVNLTLSLVRDEQGRPAYQVAMLEDVTDQHRLQQRMIHQAYHDPLTSLPNRAMFTERLEQVFSATPADSTRRVGVCFLDLDGFKTINDSLGHDVGDQMLQAVARRLAHCVEPGQLVARMGGDEFVILVADSQGEEQLGQLADTVLAALAPPLVLADQQLSATASVGVVEHAVAATSASELMRAADITLYSAKADGRGRWALYDPGHEAAAIARFTLSAAMPAAIARGEFFVVYQPLVGLGDHRMRGVEALVRWRHPELGVLAPARFIGLAEETGAIVGLGSIVLQQACRDARAWYEEFGDDAPFVSVNVAPRQLHEPTLSAEVGVLLDATGLPAHRLQVELTERALTTDEGAPLKALDGLRAMGVRIAVDDFGTGYSNLSYLRTLPVDVIKLDGSFSEGLRSDEFSDPVDERIVRTLVSLGHALGLTVIAEGVETTAQAERLRALGCDEGQGWLFASTMAAGEVAELARAGEPLSAPGPGAVRESPDGA